MADLNATWTPTSPSRARWHRAPPAPPRGRPGWEWVGARSGPEFVLVLASEDEPYEPLIEGWWRLRGGVGVGGG